MGDFTTLYLVRHGAASNDWSQGDSRRELTALGELQADAVGRFLARRSFKPDLVVTSTYQRAIQTASRISEIAFPGTPHVEDADFTPSGIAETMRNRLFDLPFPAILFVGHLPSIEMLARILSQEADFAFGNCTLAAFTLNRKTRTATLDFHHSVGELMHG